MRFHCTDVFGASVGTKKKERKKQLAHDHRIPFLLPRGSSNLPSTVHGTDGSFNIAVSISLSVIDISANFLPYRYRPILFENFYQYRYNRKRKTKNVE